MSTRSGPAAGTRQFSRMQSATNLTMPNAEEYANDDAINAVGISLYENQQFDASRPLSPSASMYEEPQYANAASNIELTFNDGINAQATPNAVPNVTASVSGGQQAGLVDMIVQIQLQLNA